MFNPQIKENSSGEYPVPGNPNQGNPAGKETKITEGIAIHTMPEQYRRVFYKADKARITGVFIVIGGALLLVLICFLAYYFMVIVPSNQKQPIIKRTETSPTATTTQEPASQPAVTPESASLQSASSTETTATSSGTLPLPEITPEATTTATSTGQTTAAEVSTSTSINYAPAEDSDNDGLSNAEELLLGTDSDNPDSDGDGYSDLAEVNNMYNPAGLGSLSGNSGIKKYTNKTYKYNLLYPTEWEEQQINEDNSIIFKSSDNQYIQVIIQPNINKLAIEEWYKAQFGVVEISPVQSIMIDNNKRPISAIKSEDGMVVYFSDPGNNQIYVVSYSTGAGNVLSYLNILHIIVASFNFSSR